MITYTCENTRCRSVSTLLRASLRSNDPLSNLLTMRVPKVMKRVPTRMFLRDSPYPPKKKMNVQCQHTMPSRKPIKKYRKRSQNRSIPSKRRLSRRRRIGTPRRSRTYRSRDRSDAFDIPFPKGGMKVNKQPEPESSHQHVGFSIDWDGCGHVLPALLMPDIDAVTRHIRGMFARDAYNSSSIQACNEMVQTILSHLPPGPCTVHIFIGSNRQSPRIDQRMFDSHANRGFGTLMFPYWDDIVEALNKRYPEHRWIFELGSCSDSPNALEDPQSVVGTTDYGSGWKQNKPLLHAFDVSMGSRKADDKDLKDKLNRYHAWRLFHLGGKKLVFLDDKHEYTYILTRVGGYPPGMTIIGQWFDSDSLVVDGTPIDTSKVYVNNT